MGEEGCDEEVASSKRKTKLKTSAKIDTLFMTKMAAEWLYKNQYPIYDKNG